MPSSAKCAVVPVIRNIASYVPTKRVDNDAFIAELGVSDSLYKKLGVRSRALKDPEQRTSDLCVRAFEQLCSQRDFAKSEIGLVCLVTQNPDQKIPHTAAIVHDKLGLDHSCMTFDVSQGCAGYPHGLAVVTSLMERLSIERGLLFTCDPYSEIVDPHDRGTALIFGDAATVTLLEPGDGYRLVDADFGTAPGTSRCLTCESMLHMDGRAILMNATREVPKSIRRLLERQQLELSQIGTYLLHPGSEFVVEALRAKLGLDAESVPFEAAEIGNTVSSSIPLMLADRLGSGHQRLLLSGFGVGFSWGTCLLQAHGSFCAMHHSSDE